MRKKEKKSKENKRKILTSAITGTGPTKQRVSMLKTNIFLKTCPWTGKI